MFLIQQICYRHHGGWKDKKSLCLQGVSNIVTQLRANTMVIQITVCYPVKSTLLGAAEEAKMIAYHKELGLYQ